MTAKAFGDQFAPIPEWILLHPELSDRAVRLFGILQRHSTDAGGRIPGRARLRELLGCSYDSLDRAKAELEQAGAITVVKRFKPGLPLPRGQLTNDYQLCTDSSPTSRTRAVSTSRKAAAGLAAPVRPVVKATSETKAPRLKSVDELREEHDPEEVAPPPPDLRRRA
jgi:hypothetical protein